MTEIKRSNRAFRRTRSDASGDHTGAWGERQDGLVKNRYDPVRQTLGLELVASPELLLDNEWRGDLDEPTTTTPPALHRNGVDYFDDSSIATGGGTLVLPEEDDLPRPREDPGAGLLGRIASTARDAVGRLGTAARDRGHPTNRPLDCLSDVSACATRRDGGDGGDSRRRGASPPMHWVEGRKGGRAAHSPTFAPTSDRHGRRDAGGVRRGSAAAGRRGGGLRVTVTDATAIPDALLLA